MEMQRTTLSSFSSDAMSEVAIATAPTTTSTINGSNKRKRRSSIDEKDIENQRPPTKKAFSSSEDDEIAIELLASPQAINILSKSENGITRNQITRSTTINNNNSSNTNMNGTVTGSSAEMTPQSLKKVSSETTTTATTTTWTSCTKCCGSRSSDFRLCPLPALSWGDAKDVWRFMCKKDEKAAFERDSKMLHNHPGLQSRMRAILLDWLIEVCEVYKLHRETYYLALDYLDRYLSTNVSISKTYLQLIGITCLFIAAKVEEIYPPKISEFAYVTDGACREEDILKQELVILTALKWQITPVTIVGWLSVYMQLNVTKRLPKRGEVVEVTTEETDDAFVFPQFSGLEYAQTAQLLDLCTLDVGIADYPYSVIAAAAISHTFNKKAAIKLSGLDWATISPCSRWMEPFFRICLESPKLCLMESNEQIPTKHGLGHICPNITADDSHIIQMHTTNMEMFDEAMSYKEQTQQEASPAPPRTVTDHVCPPDGLLTPPATSRKFIETQPDSTCK